MLSFVERRLVKLDGNPGDLDRGDQRALGQGQGVSHHEIKEEVTGRGSQGSEGVLLTSFPLSVVFANSMAGTGEC